MCVILWADAPGYTPLPLVGQEFKISTRFPLGKTWRKTRRARRERCGSMRKHVLVAIPCLRSRSMRLWVGAERWAVQGKGPAVRPKRPAALLKPKIVGPLGPAAQRIPTAAEQIPPAG